jgi:SAM-dependent methyltransferase
MRTLRSVAETVIPPKYLPHLQRIIWHARSLWYLRFGRLRYPGESEHARPRREREGFFEKYCNGRGLDIGYGGDLLCPNCEGFDFEHGDIHYLPGIPENAYDFVNASHVLEHMEEPEFALRRWFRVLRPGGYFILAVPHRDLYEKRTRLPSRWNLDHKRFFLVDEDEPPDTVGLLPLLARSLSGYSVVYAKVCDEGHTITDPDVASDGEFSIEVVLCKDPVGQ